MDLDVNMKYMITIGKSGQRLSVVRRRAQADVVLLGGQGGAWAREGIQGNLGMLEVMLDD